VRAWEKLRKTENFRDRSFFQVAQPQLGFLGAFAVGRYARRAQDSRGRSATRALASAPGDHVAEEDRYMQFILGVFLFVVVLGGVDAFIPWPKPRRSQGEK
jgi:hypothetical protein